MNKYILDGRTPVLCDDLMDWGKWFKEAERSVAQIQIGKVMISTVFLGLDHNWGTSGNPLLFETMIFGGPHDQYQHRYSTYEEAEQGHTQAVAMVMADAKREQEDES